MREQLRALVKLSEIDARARGVDEQLKGIPAELEERRGAVRALESLVSRQTAAIVEAEKLVGQQDADLASRNDLLGKSKAKGAKARTMRESDAAERELESIRKSIKDGEAEKERLRERVSATRSALDAPEMALEEQRSDLEKAEVAATARLEALRAERQEILVGRGEWASQIAKDHLRLYDRLRTKLSPAVVEATAETCLGCRMKIPPQRFLELQRCNTLMQCSFCNRIVYHRDLMQD